MSAHYVSLKKHSQNDILSLVLYVVVKGNPALADDAEIMPPNEFAVGGAELLMNGDERPVNVRNSNNNHNNNNNEPHHHQGVDETVRRDSNFTAYLPIVVIDTFIN